MTNTVAQTRREGRRPTAARGHAEPRVLMTDAHTRASIAVARGLADDGFSVIAAAPATWPTAAGWSRAVSRRVTLPEPTAHEGPFLSALDQIVRDEHVDVLLPGTDAALRSVSRGRDQLEPHVRIGLPSEGAVRRSLDKLELGAAGGIHGLQAPPTRVCRAPEDVRAAALAFGLPMILKGPTSIVEGPFPTRSSGMLVADERRFDEVFDTFGEIVLAQPRLGGAVVSFAGVRADGRLLGEAVSRYHRTWQVQAGNACFSETFCPSQSLRERVCGVLAQLGWEGLFELELIEAATGDWRVIDLNPRPYGSLALALGAGCNLPALWCRHLLGEPVAECRARPGVRYRWTDADVRHGLWQLRHGDVCAAARAMTPRRNVVHPYRAPGDTGPGIARVLELGTLAAKRARSPHGGCRSPLPTVVIGAGPNGLAAAAHLEARGVRTVCFGEPMESWAHNMPPGMLLRSRWRASHIADPHRSLMLEDFARAENRSLDGPQITREQFVDYGRWFARRGVARLEPRQVTAVTRAPGGGFEVTVQDGERLRAASVVVAAGLMPFTARPDVFAALPADRCTHAYDHGELSHLAGRRVAVVGAGQSALECAALLREAGATPLLLCRAPAIRWLAPHADAGADGATAPSTGPRRPWIPVSAPPTDVGGRLTGWLAAVPDAWRALPERWRPEVSFRCIRPAGSDWLRPRLTEVPFTFGVEVREARVGAGEIHLALSDGTERRVDHVLLGTGYHVDVRRYPFLSGELSAGLDLVDGSPVLGAGLESSIPGLHFMGASAARSFGPIMRFVVGSWYAAPALARRVAGSSQPPLRVAFPRTPSTSPVSRRTPAPVAPPSS